jgi:hypothetical protein
MSVEENKAIVRRLFEGFYQKRNSAVLDELVSPDYVRHGAGVGWRTAPTRGPDVYLNDVRVL